ncbi:MAG TPA: DinB family protein [Acidobacteriaceae bacterium]|nr:DinB family protein [Acidobacteriaceae bacterium]
MNAFPALFRHLAWADASLLAAIAAHPESLGDERVQKLLRHILRAERVLYARFTGGDADAVREIPAEFAAVVALFRTAHRDLLAFVDGLSEDDAARTFPLPALEIHPTVAEGLTQVILHGQNHRGQCLLRLRENGATPPNLDYIFWIKGRPGAVYPEV